jgi:hypothetical protein
MRRSSGGDVEASWADPTLRHAVRRAEKTGRRKRITPYLTFPAPSTVRRWHGIQSIGMIARDVSALAIEPTWRRRSAEPEFCDRESGRLQAALFLLAVAFGAGVLGPFPFARVVELVDTQVSEACA